MFSLVDYFQFNATVSQSILKKNRIKSLLYYISFLLIYTYDISRAYTDGCVDSVAYISSLNFVVIFKSRSTQSKCKVRWFSVRHGSAALFWERGTGKIDESSVTRSLSRCKFKRIVNAPRLYYKKMLGSKCKSICIGYVDDIEVWWSSSPYSSLPAPASSSSALASASTAAVASTLGWHGRLLEGVGRLTARYQLVWCRCAREQVKAFFDSAPLDDLVSFVLTGHPLLRPSSLLHRPVRRSARDTCTVIFIVSAFFFARMKRYRANY